MPTCHPSFSKKIGALRASAHVMESPHPRPNDLSGESELGDPVRAVGHDGKDEAKVLVQDLHPQELRALSR